MGAKKLSRLTEKYQATIPAEVREVLHLKKGDRVVFEVKSAGLVVIRKALEQDIEWNKGVEEQLSEWASANDEKAYGDL